MYRKGTEMKMTLSKRLIAAVLAAVMALACLAACSNSAASVVNRNPDSKRGTTIHNGF